MGIISDFLNAILGSNNEDDDGCGYVFGDTDYPDDYMDHFNDD